MCAAAPAPRPMYDVIAAASTDWKLGSDVIAFAIVSVTAGAAAGAPWTTPPLDVLCRYEDEWAAPYSCSALVVDMPRPKCCPIAGKELLP